MFSDNECGLVNLENVNNITSVWGNFETKNGVRLEEGSLDLISFINVSLTFVTVNASGVTYVYPISSIVVENLELAEIRKVPTVLATPVKVSVTFAVAPFADTGRYPSSLERDTTESLC